VFPVSTSKAKTVGALKDAIKVKKKPLFDHISADILELYKASLAKADFYTELVEIDLDYLNNMLDHLDALTGTIGRVLSSSSRRLSIRRYRKASRW
jgi:Crinkler effector protein N-terminal domain